jgi:predicted DNA binding CopG/RHH family protein
MKKQIQTLDPYDVELDEYEQELEDNLELCTRLSPAEAKLEIAKLVAAAKNHVKAKKSITLRVAPYDLEIMRLKASKLGVPYQTYINMVIHKDASVF